MKTKTPKRILERHKAWRSKNPDRIQMANRKQIVRRYGITIETYDRMLQEQEGTCKICASPPGTRRLAVDHCHETGVVRGLLCYRCNIALGYFRHNDQLLQKAADYLSTYDRHEPAPPP